MLKIEKNNQSSPLHKPVLIAEILNILQNYNHKTYIDATFGAGGYTKQILKNTNCKIIAFDRDPSVISIANEVQNQFGTRFQFIHDKFSNIPQYVDKIDGIIADFGISSMQIDNYDRGFSFNKEAKLNMQMGKCEITAFDVINSFSEKELADIIFKYSNERLACKIASMIYTERKKNTIFTTTHLASIIYEAYNKPNHYKIHPATKTFQAIRIFVNKELDEIESLLENSSKIINQNGILACVSFHELEDRIVKQFFEKNSEKKIKKNKYSQKIITDNTHSFEVITKKPIEPSEYEIKENPRSRSAKLRIGKRI